ncbi:MAG: ABC transporter ATP-binding protein [Candidatus Dormiibacterota bacterium]
MIAPLLEVEGLCVTYGMLRAAQDVSLRVGARERVGIVGESGSGKSTVAFAIAGLLRPPGSVTAGGVRFGGNPLLGRSERDVNEVRGSRLGLVYQDPFTVLDPVMRAGDQVAEVLWAHAGAARSEGRRRAAALLDRLGLRPGEAFATRFPHQLSGGQRQRVAIAMAVVSEPQLLIADEPTTALDVTVQAQILRLLLGIVRDLGSSLILITHDLAVVRALCTRVYVMYAGRVVEEGPVDAVLAQPEHPYTRALLEASRRPVSTTEPFSTIPGSPPDLRQQLSGCPFAPRCPARMDRCAEAPELLPVDPDRQVACWLRTPAT